MNSRKLVKKVIPKGAFRRIEPYGHWAEAVIAQRKAGFPAKKLKVIGVTGTDGKTTTCMLIGAVLRSAGLKTAVITTASIDYGDGKGEQINPTQLTTGSATQLNKLIQKIGDNGVEWLVLEVSSHALAQRRVWGIPFTLAVMTNMSPEHLDYHGTFENYRKAKERLFKLANANKHGLRTGVINADDATAEFFARNTQTALTYGIKKGDVRAKKIESDLKGNRFIAEVDGDSYKVETKLIGEFNVYNALATIAAARLVGLSPHQIEKGLPSLPYVTGRMMPVSEGQNFTVLIDYAVTPAALENVLKTVRNLAKSGKIHIVFGATGDRDRTKRPKMGEVTAKLADYVYLTDDETYTEDGAKIRQAVLGGVPKAQMHKVAEFDDRKVAIASALKKAKKGDVVIIAGIGHQTSRNMGGKKVPWSDIEVTQKLLKELKK